MENEIKELGIIKIGEDDKDKVIIALKSYQDKKYLDVRRYYKNDTGKMLPTKKGVTFSLSQLKELSKVLTENKEAIEDWLK